MEYFSEQLLVINETLQKLKKNQQISSSERYWIDEAEKAVNNLKSKLNYTEKNK